MNREVTAIWSAIIPGYYSHSEAPLSQPESRALDQLLATGSFDRMASLHSFGGYLYYPWSGRFRPPPDEAQFVAIGRAMERAQAGHAYRTRQLARWGFFFRAQGSELDHAYGEYGTLPFLVELTRSGISPLHALRDRRTYFRWYNPRDPRPHVERGVAAMRALAAAPGDRVAPRRAAPDTP